MLLGGKVCDMTSKFPGLESIAVLLLLWSEFLNRNSVVQNIMRMDKALYESTDDGARRSIIDREGQSISKLCVYPNENMSVSFHEGSSPIWPTYHQVAGLFLQGRVPNRRASVSLCSQLFRPSAIAEQQAKLTLVRRWYYWAHVKSPLQTTWLFCTWVHLESTRMAGWWTSRECHFVYLVIERLLFWWCLLVSICMEHRYLHTVSHSEKSLYISLSPDLLISVFQSCPLQVLDHPTHESLQIHTSDHVSVSQTR